MHHIQAVIRTRKWAIIWMLWACAIQWASHTAVLNSNNSLEQRSLNPGRLSVGEGEVRHLKTLIHFAGLLITFPFKQGDLFSFLCFDSDDVRDFHNLSIAKNCVVDLKNFPINHHLLAWECPVLPDFFTQTTNNQCRIGRGFENRWCVFVGSINELFGKHPHSFWLGWTKWFQNFIFPRSVIWLPKVPASNERSFESLSQIWDEWKKYHRSRFRCSPVPKIPPWIRYFKKAIALSTSINVLTVPSFLFVKCNPVLMGLCLCSSTWAPKIRAESMLLCWKQANRIKEKKSREKEKKRKKEERFKPFPKISRSDKISSKTLWMLFGKWFLTRFGKSSLICQFFLFFFEVTKSRKKLFFSTFFISSLISSCNSGICPFGSVGLNSFWINLENLNQNSTRGEGASKMTSRYGVAYAICENADIEYVFVIESSRK